jgi:metaxin
VPANEPLLAALYLSPATRSGLVQRANLASLRRAARAEVLAAVPGGGPAVASGRVYAGARDAFGALETLLEGCGGVWFGGEEGGGDRRGAEQPGEMDAAVFAYTHLILGGGGVSWVDGRLRVALEEFPLLVGHRTRLAERLWNQDGRAAGVDDSVVWEKV